MSLNHVESFLEEYGSLVLQESACKLEILFYVFTVEFRIHYSSCDALYLLNYFFFMSFLVYFVFNFVLKRAKDTHCGGYLNELTEAGCHSSL